MRKEFAQWAERYYKFNRNTVFLTGDLGFMALEGLKTIMEDRFINTGVAEQNMISMGAAMSRQGLQVTCYSIAPFLVFRPAEQIRLDVCLHNLDVKLVGNGGGYGYGIMGPTHHAIEDICFLSSLSNMRCYIPICSESVAMLCEEMMNFRGPAYLRLGFGNLPENMIPRLNNSPICRLATPKNPMITVVGMGPVVLEAIKAIQNCAIEADIFAVQQIPFQDSFSLLLESLLKTGRLLIVEEHVQHGGLGSILALLLIHHRVICSVKHVFAVGYPNGRYGSQAYHRKCSGLDEESLRTLIGLMTK